MRGLIGTAAALFVLAFVGTAAGFDSQATLVADESAATHSLVAMAPQSNLKVLSHATKVGPHAKNATIKLTVALRLRNKTKLKNFLARVQNPHSEVYRQWLTPAEFTREYGPTKAEVAKVVAFLERSHIRILGVSSNRMLIHTEASTTQYEHALKIRINDYGLDGRRFYSAANAPMLPPAIAPLVANVLGLNHGVQVHTHYFQRPVLNAHDLEPRAAPPVSLTYLNPLQIARAYDYPDIHNSSNAAGVNIAILTAQSTGLAAVSDPHEFWAAFGLPDHTINVIPVNGDGNNVKGMVETMLDIEYSGALGSGATLNVYVGADSFLSTFINVYNQFANDTNPDGTPRNQVMSTSWGAPEALWGSLAQTAEQIFMQAAAEGISMFAAAGDYGSGDGTGLDNVADFPSSSTYITAANGTQLTISDLSGTYGGEVVWNDAICFGGSFAATGGAVSQVFGKPAWQTGPGVPSDVDMRMNSDMAATASCSRPMLLLSSGQWSFIAGTSAVAPQFAGLFAIAVAANGHPLGQANELIYNDARIYYGSDFHDVTEGNNGAFQAGFNWDHPTGWGSPDVLNFLSHVGVQGPSGTFTGTVTDAASDVPLAGASIDIVGSGGEILRVTTDDKGTYSRLLPVGDYTVTVSKFGFADAKASVAITDSNETTQDFALAAAPKATLSGKVSDGSGHGYPLYAHLLISTAGFGVVAQAWTDPYSGAYSLELPAGLSYDVKVVSYAEGYQPATGSVALNDDAVRDFSLTVGMACLAPGYKYTTFGENFDGPTFPPTGWRVTTAIPGAEVFWELNTAWGVQNVTGGRGAAADADSAAAGSGGGLYDTSLITPPIPVTSLAHGTILRYKANFQVLAGNSHNALDLGISTDRGATWTTISHWTENHGGLRRLPGETVQVDLAPYVPTSGDFQLRWRYYNLVSDWDRYAMIDDVSIGKCMPLRGGIVKGSVTDQGSSQALVGAQLRADTGQSARAFINPSDPNLVGGLYILFLPAGDRTLTASSGRYTPQTIGFTVPANGTIRKDFALKAAKFAAAPGSVDLDVQVGTQVTKELSVMNVGTDAGLFTIAEVNAPPPQTVAGPANTGKVPLREIHGHFTPDVRGYTTSVRGVRNHPPPPWALRRAVPHDGTSWQNIANLPVAVMDDAAGRDPATGFVYVVGGQTGGSNSVALKSLYIYDPADDSWSQGPDAPVAHIGSTAQFAYGKLYVFNGWTSLDNTPQPEVDVYDPATSKWSTGTPNPVPAAGYSASAVVGGKIYIVGGCDDGHCVTPTAAVQVYDPATDSWSAAAPYPHGAAFLMCGGIGGKLYCAGGVTNREFRDGYVYDPATDKWSRIAPIPVEHGGLWGSGYTVADGDLLISGGITNMTHTITNAGHAYNPATDSWEPLPNANYALYRGASACGFFRIGGNTGRGGSNTVATAEVLPGRSPCVQSNIPWLTESPARATVEAGHSATVRLSFDGVGRKPSTSSKAYLRITGTPYEDTIVPVTVHWKRRLEADLGLTGPSSTAVSVGKSATMTLTVSNNGPDVAGGVELKATVPSSVSAQSVVPSQGQCASGDSIKCDLGDVAPGDPITVLITFNGVSAGSASLSASVSTTSVDSNSDNDSLTLPVTVKAASSSGGGGGGALGWFALASLLFLVFCEIRGLRARRQ